MKKRTPSFIKSGNLEKSTNLTEGLIPLYIVLNRMILENKLTRIGAQQRPIHNRTKLPDVVFVNPKIITKENNCCNKVITEDIAGF